MHGAQKVAVQPREDSQLAIVFGFGRVLNSAAAWRTTVWAPWLRTMAQVSRTSASFKAERTGTLQRMSSQPLMRAHAQPGGHSRAVTAFE